MEQELEIKELFEKLLPPLDEESFNSLEKDILKRGIIEPLLVWNNILIDGHHRYKISKKYKIPFQIKELKDLNNEIDVCKWMIEHQLSKRNLKLLDKANLSINYYNFLRKINPKEKDDSLISITSKLFNIKKTTFQKFKTVKESGNEKLLKLLTNEEKSIDDLYKKYLKWKQTSHRKNETIKKNGEGIFHNTNCFDFMKLIENKNKYDIIITQTPTSCDTEILKKIPDRKMRVGYCNTILKKTLSALENVTKEKCFYFFIANIDDYILFLETIKSNLFYMSTLVWNTAFTKVYTEPYRLNNTHKYIIMACKGYDINDLKINKCSDHIESIKTNRKGVPINIIDYLLRIVEKDDSYIFDPFAGYGSVISASILRKLKVEGCEINTEIYNIACDYIESDRKTILL